MVCASSNLPAPSAIGICNPVGVSLDGTGNLFVGDAANNRVLEYNRPLAAHNPASGAGDVTGDVVLGQGASGAAQRTADGGRVSAAAQRLGTAAQSGPWISTRVQKTIPISAEARAAASAFSARCG